MHEKVFSSPPTPGENSEMLKDSIHEFFRKPKPRDQQEAGITYYVEDVHTAAIGIYIFSVELLRDFINLDIKTKELTSSLCD